MEETLTQLFAFIKEIDKEKLIGRQTYLTDGMRKENDAEHAWHEPSWFISYFRRGYHRGSRFGSI